jgi:hypothetical protein
LFVFNGSVVEGNSGTTTDMLMEVRMSAATGRTITVNYATANFSALAALLAALLESTTNRSQGPSRSNPGISR